MNLLEKIQNEAKNPKIKVSHKEDELLPKKVNQSAMNLETNNNYADTNELIESLEKELAEIPEISSKKIGVRLEKVLYDAIRAFCNDLDITVETLLESFFLICQNDPDLMSEIVEEAQQRIKQRTRAGNIRSLLTKTRNLHK